jgi:hypothetical protein
MNVSLCPPYSSAHYFYSLLSIPQSSEAHCPWFQDITRATSELVAHIGILAFYCTGSFIVASIMAKRFCPSEIGISAYFLGWDWLILSTWTVISLVKPLRKASSSCNFSCQLTTHCVQTPPAQRLGSGTYTDLYRSLCVGGWTGSV